MSLITGVLSEITEQSDFPEIDKMVLSLRRTYPEIQDIVKKAEEYQKNNNRIEPTIQLNPPASIPEAKREIEDYFRGKTKMKEVIVLGPYENEYLEITRLLTDSAAQLENTNHYFIYGSLDDPSNIEIADLLKVDNYSGKLGLEKLHYHIIFSKTEFTEYHFRNFPIDSYFFPSVPDPNSEEVNTVFQTLVDSILKADLLDNETLDQILNSQESYRKLISSAALLSKTDIPLVLTGDSKAYRRKIGKMIHSRSNHKKGMFIFFDCMKFRHKQYDWFIEKFFKYFFLNQNLVDGVTDASSNSDNGNVSNESFNNYITEFFRLDKSLDIDNVNEWTILFDGIGLLDESRISYIQNFLEENNLESYSSNKTKIRLLFGLRDYKDLKKADKDLTLDEYTPSPMNIPSFNDYENEAKISILRSILDRLNEVILNCQSNSIFALYKFKVSDNGLKEMTNYIWPGGFEQICAFFKFLTVDVNLRSNIRIGLAGSTTVVYENDSSVASALRDWAGLGKINQAENIQFSGFNGFNRSKFSRLYKVDSKLVSDLPAMLDEIEREYILDAIKNYGGSQAKVAFKLGYSQPVISRKIAKYKLSQFNDSDDD